LGGVGGGGGGGGVGGGGGFLGRENYATPPVGGGWKRGENPRPPPPPPQAPPPPPEEVILNIPVLHSQDQSNSEGYTDGSDTHFSEQPDPHADTRGPPALNSGDQDSPDVDHAVSDTSDSEDHPGAATRPRRERRPPVTLTYSQMGEPEYQRLQPVVTSIQGPPVIFPYKVIGNCLTPYYTSHIPCIPQLQYITQPYGYTSTEHCYSRISPLRVLTIGEQNCVEFLPVFLLSVRRKLNKHYGWWSCMQFEIGTLTLPQVMTRMTCRILFLYTFCNVGTTFFSRRGVSSKQDESNWD